MSEQASSTEGQGQGGAPLLEVTDLSVEFATDEGWVTVLDGVSFDIGPGEIVGLVGESGSGKSVTGMSIMRLIPNPPGRIVSGRIRLGDLELTALSERDMRRVRGRRIGMVFQEPMTGLNPAFTIGDQIAESARHHLGHNRRQSRRHAQKMLDLVGISGADRRVDAYPHEFSGGMRQRAMIAIALACEPQLLIADEPTTALDVTVQAQILELLRQMQRDMAMSVLLITHDLGVVAETSDRVVVMYAGEVVETARVEGLFDRPRHPYTHGLLAALPQLGARADRLASIPGVPPQPSALPPGCRFAPRCQFSVDACNDEPPPLIVLGPDRRCRCIRVDELELRGVD